MHKEYHGLLFGVCAAISLSIMAVFVKLTSGVSNETVVFARFFIALILLWVILPKQKFQISLKSIPKHLVRGVVGLLSIYCYFYALKNLPLVTATTLSTTAPLFIPVVLLFWHKLLVSKRRILGAILGFVGVVVIMRPSTGFSEWASLSALASGFFSAIAFVGLRFLSKSEPTATIILYYLTIASVLSFLPMVSTWKAMPDHIVWAFFLAIGVFGLIYQYFLTLAYTHAPATKASAVSYFSVVFGGLADWLIWGVVPHAMVLVGIALIVLGAMIALFDKTPPHNLSVK